MLLYIQMLNSVPKDLVALRQGDPLVDQFLLCKPCPTSYPWLVNKDAYSLYLGRREIGMDLGAWAWGPVSYTHLTLPTTPYV